LGAGRQKLVECYGAFRRRVEEILA
jgi:hypothetical protein